MSKCSARRAEGWPQEHSAVRAAGIARLRTAAALIGIVLAVQAACLLRKPKAAAPKATPQPVRIVYLPLNVPSDNTDLRWVSLAVPIMMAKVSEEAPDLDPVPLWEAMPVAVEAAGNLREITAENAAYIASRLTAKWASQGDLSPTKGGVLMTVDFIPAKSTLIPFRYQKESGIDSLGGHFEDAFDQFLRYLILRPLTRPEGKSVAAAQMKEVAEAFDREYGWFVTAEPGKSDKVVSELAASDSRLARLLFNPNLYPSVGVQPKSSE